MRSLRTALWTLTVPGLLSAQTDRDGPGAFTLASQAEKLISQEKFDEALVLLWAAESKILEVDGATARDMTRKSIEALLKKADPILATRRREFLAITNELVKLAQRYLRKKWIRTGGDVLRAGGMFVPQLVEKRLTYVEKRLRANADAAPATPTEAPKAEGPEDRFADFRAEHYTSDKWTKDGNVFVSPRIEEATEFVIAGNVRHGDERLRWEVQVDGRSEASGALVFGALADNDYYLAEIGNFEGANQGWATLFYWDGEKVQRLAEKHFSIKPADRGKWRQGELHVRGRELSLHVDGRKVVSTTGPRDTHGAVGVFVNGRSKNKEPVRFRNLRIDALPDPSAAKAKPDPADALRGALAQRLSNAEAAIERGDREEAALALRAMRPELDALGDATRAAMRAALDELIAKADPFAGPRRTIGTAIADKLGHLAQAYVVAKRPLSALQLLDRAALFDPNVAGAFRDKLSDELAPVLAKIHGLPPEPDVPADDRALRDEFEGGRGLWTAEPWQFRDGAAIAPTPGATGAALLGKTANDKFGTARLQVRGRGDVERAIIFSFRSRHDFWVASVAPHDGGRLAVAHYFGGKWQKVANRKVKFSPEALAAWMTIEVSFGPKSIRARFGKSEVLEAKTPETFRPGRFGLWVTPGDGAASFRNFSFEPAK